MIKLVRYTRLESYELDFLQEVDISPIQSKYLDKGFTIKSVSTSAVWPKFRIGFELVVSYTYVLEKI